MQPPGGEGDPSAVRGQSRANVIGVAASVADSSSDDVVATTNAVSLARTGLDTHTSGVALLQPPPPPPPPPLLPALAAASTPTSEITDVMNPEINQIKFCRFLSIIIGYRID